MKCATCSLEFHIALGVHLSKGTKNPRKVVMISSTARDLPQHRDLIRLGCERAGFEPRVMEHLPALDADAIKASLRMVALRRG